MTEREKHHPNEIGCRSDLNPVLGCIVSEVLNCVENLVGDECECRTKKSVFEISSEAIWLSDMRLFRFRC